MVLISSHVIDTSNTPTWHSKNMYQYRNMYLMIAPQDLAIVKVTVHYWPHSYQKLVEFEVRMNTTDVKRPPKMKLNPRDNVQMTTSIARALTDLPDPTQECNSPAELDQAVHTFQTIIQTITERHSRALPQNTRKYNNTLTQQIPTLIKSRENVRGNCKTHRRI